MQVDLTNPVSTLAGIGAVRAAKLDKLGIRTVGDLLAHYPRGYEDRRKIYSITEAPEGVPACISAMIAEVPRTARIRKGMDLTRVKAVDGSSTVLLTFFNQAYVRDALKPGETYIFYGKMEIDGRARRMNNPLFEPEGCAKHTGCIVPVYSLTAGIGNNLMLEWIRQVLPAAEKHEECFSEKFRSAHDLIDMESAVKQIHFPHDYEELCGAKRRMIFEELFLLTAGLSLLSGRRSTSKGPVFSRNGAEAFMKQLPFKLTGAQTRVMQEIASDMSSGTPMNRLVQGDVGSGKTVIAAYGAWITWKNGWQSALMAPTEILAEQHYKSLNALLAPTGMRIGLLTGTVKGAERKKRLKEIAAGEYDLIVGTHALLSEDVCYLKLGLAVADEQHRFGVTQRAALAAKGGEGGIRPHVLVMSATPIPRTLALIIYGDLDISVMDELPPGRLPIETYLISEKKRAQMYGFARKIVESGRQAYIVCPAVEEADPEAAEPEMDLKAVTRYAAELQNKIFPDLRIGFVHGKLKSKEKDAVMAAFAAGELDILVSTTVIEVGVDVPNAALMIVENAERFGLSQLHQLRGRVGRGPWQSYCVLITATRNEESRARLKVMTSTTDGFKIAEEDLKLRGPGDFFGARQHGLPGLKIADLAGDMLLLKEAQDAAKEVLAQDAGLCLPEHRVLREKVWRLFAENPDIFN